MLAGWVLHCCVCNCLCCVCAQLRLARAVQRANCELTNLPHALHVSLDCTAPALKQQNVPLVLRSPHTQARAEDCSESLAFVHLLNALWRGGAQMADDGRGVAHFTRFVRDDVLGTAFQVGRSTADCTSSFKPSYDGRRLA